MARYSSLACVDSEGPDVQFRPFLGRRDNTCPPFALPIVLACHCSWLGSLRSLQCSMWILWLVGRWYEPTATPQPCEEPKTLSMVAERGGRWARAYGGSSSSGSAAASAGPLPPPAGTEPEPGPEGTSVPRWAGIVRHLFRLRRLQRLWHHLGEFLRTQVSSSLRLQLSQHFRQLEKRR